MNSDTRLDLVQPNTSVQSTDQELHGWLLAKQLQLEEGEEEGRRTHPIERKEKGREHKEPNCAL